MKLKVKDLVAESKKSQSQRLRATIWRWWDWDFRQKQTALTSEAFYFHAMEDIIRDVKTKFPDERFNESDIPQ